MKKIFLGMVISLIVANTQCASEVTEQNPIRTAVNNGDVALLKSFITPQNINIPGCGFGRTLLMYASLAKQKEIALFLLENGADYNTKCPAGNTALHYAVKSNCFDIVEMLINKEADIYAENDQGETPLSVAMQMVDGKMMQLLILSGADTNKVSKEVESLFRKTLYLLENCDKIAGAEFEQIIKWGTLLGADINQLHNEGLSLFGSSTLLAKVLRKGRLDLLPCLINAGAHINSIQESGIEGISCAHTALQIAADTRNTEAIAILLGAGAQSHISDSEGRTPFEFAIKCHNNKDVIEQFINHGDFLICTDTAPVLRFNSPLIRLEEHYIVPHLIRQRVILHQGTDKDDIRAYEIERNLPITLESGSIETLAMQIDLSSIQHLSPLEGLAMIAEKHCLDELSNKNGVTCLMDYVRINYGEGIEYILDRTLDVDIKDHHERTALHHAVFSQGKESIALLLKHNANYAARDIYGKTPRDYIEDEQLLQFFDQATNMQEPDLTWPEDAQ